MKQAGTWILVVDDDEEDHAILRDYFADVDMADRLQFSANGKTALDLLSQKPDSDLPGLIVLDLNMPILNGPLTLQQLKQSPRFRNIPVVIYSTSENAGERRKCLNYGAADFLIKPSGYDAGVKIMEQMRSLASL